MSDLMKMFVPAKRCKDTYLAEGEVLHQRDGTEYEIVAMEKRVHVGGKRHMQFAGYNLYLEKVS